MAGVAGAEDEAVISQSGKKDENMNKWQELVVSEAPTSAKATMSRAFSGKSKTAGIRAFCLRCVGYSRSDIRDCTSYGCPLHPYRPFQADDEPDELPPEQV